MAATEFHAGDEIEIAVRVAGDKTDVTQINLDLANTAYYPGEFPRRYTRITLTADCTTPGVFEQDEHGRIILHGRIYSAIFGGFFKVYCTRFEHADGTETYTIEPPDASFRIYVADNWDELRKHQVHIASVDVVRR
jgi:hypothetical protein